MCSGVFTSKQTCTKSLFGFEDKKNNGQTQHTEDKYQQDQLKTTFDI